MRTMLYAEGCVKGVRNGCERGTPKTFFSRLVTCTSRKLEKYVHAFRKLSARELDAECITDFGCGG